jgi:hypothetical protein
MSNDWNKQLRQLADDYQRQAPKGLLGDVRRELARRQLSPAQPSGTGRQSIRRWVAVAAAVALVAGVAVVSRWTADRQSGTSLVKTEKRVKGQGADGGTTLEECDYGVAQAGHSAVGNAVTALLTQVTLARVNVSTADSLGRVEHQNDDAQPAEPVAEKTPAAAEPMKRKPISAVEEPLLASSETYRHDHASAWQVAIAYSNMGGMPRSNGTGSEMMMYNAMDAMGYNEPLAAYTNNLESAPPTVSAERHHRPLRASVSVGYSLTPRWSLQSGLTYSYLNSEFKANRGNTSSATTQKLHYVGIPLSASYAFWQTRHVRVYASGGGMAEWLVSGKAKTIETVGGIHQPATSAGVSDHRPVFSVQGAVGVEYQATRHLGIFAEPGVSYYFDNGSGVKSSYTDRPFNFNLNLGVRLNIK